MKATCPKDPTHKRFSTVAHVMELWEVDETGEFIDVIETLQTSFPPNSHNIWTCIDCDAQAKVED